MSNPFNKDNFNKDTFSKETFPKEVSPEEPTPELSIPAAYKSDGDSPEDYGTVSEKPNGVVSEDFDKAVTGKLPKAYPKEDILPILDSLLQHGYALETFSIRNTNVVLRSRFGWEEEASVKAVESSNSNIRIGQERLFILSLLAASLVEYGKAKFPPINSGTKEELEKNYENRLSFVRSLPTTITDILIARLQEFDRKQAYMVENFDKLSKDF